MPDDPAAKARFASLLRVHQSRLLSYIHALVRDMSDADDLFQQTALILWNKFDSYDANRNFGAWACGIARLEVSNYIRTRSRKKLYLSDDLTLLMIEAAAENPPVEEEERRQALADCMEKLRQRDRELLLACYGESDESVTTIADRMSRSSQSVHNSLKRIRQALFECVRRSISV